MRGTVMYAAGDVRIENVPDPRVQEPTDAVIRVTRACICGSDLWPYKTLQPSDGARVMGHEAIGIVGEIGSDVRTLKVGDVVVTSGLGGLFPGGIPIGRVRTIDDRGSALFSYAQVTPAVDFARIDEVLLLTGGAARDVAASFRSDG